jgi:hypothetical protein
MQELLVPPVDPFPEIAIESIRKLYPYPRKKPVEQRRIHEALGRIVAGEIDGQPRSPADAIAFLRERTQGARRMLLGREKKFIPHASTFFHQSRYLRSAVLAEEVPVRLEEALGILRCYPNVVIRGRDLEAHLAVLRVIDACLAELGPTRGGQAAAYLRERVERYAACVARWDPADLQYLPGAIRFFKERRYEQNPQHWDRKPPSGYAAERAQLQRLTQLGGG